MAIVTLLPGDIPVYITPMTIVLIPTFYSIIVSIWLYGIVVSQVFTYYRYSWRADPIYERAIVVALSTFVSLFVIAFLIEGSPTFTTHFGDPLALLNTLSKSEFGMVMGLILTVATSQTFFAIRCYRFAGCRLWIAIASVLFIGSTVALGIRTEVIMVRDWMTVYYEVEAKEIGNIWIADYALSAAFDTSIAAYLCYHFYKLRQGFTLRRTDDLLMKLMNLTLSTSALTSAFAIASAVAASVKNGGLFMIFVSVHTVLYALSVLFTLNARHYLVTCRGAGDEDGVKVTLESVRHCDGRTSDRESGRTSDRESGRTVPSDEEKHCPPGLA